MKTKLGRINGRWLAPLLVVLSVLVWGLADERNRQATRLSDGEARFVALQASISEIEGLRRQSPAPAAPVSEETLRAAMRSAGLDLTVRREGADRLRVQGGADFDRAMAFFASLHRDYRLRLVTLAAARDGTAARIDALLGGSEP
jgi:type II secretory pathway component PulM